MEPLPFVALKCPNCGGRLEVTNQMSTFACGYCGVGVAVQRRGGTVSLSLEDAIARVQVGTDKTAAELAINRLSVELASARMEYRAYEGATNTLLHEHETELQRANPGWLRYVVVCGVGAALSLFAVGSLISRSLFFFAGKGGFSWLSPALRFSMILSVLFGAAATAYILRTRSIKSMASIEERRTAILNSRHPGLHALKARVENLEKRLAENRRIADS